MSTTHQTATATAVVALALALSIGTTTAPAQAAPNLSMSAHIDYHPVDGTHNDVYVIDIHGVVTMSAPAAQDSINHGYTIALRYWGDDPSSDDLMAGPLNPQTVYASSDGLRFVHSLTMSRSLLNEDGGLNVLVDHTSEIYVGSRLLDPSGKTVSLVESNRIVNDFV
jgi:hypothetical protein